MSAFMCQHETITRAVRAICFTKLYNVPLLPSCGGIAIPRGHVGSEPSLIGQRLILINAAGVNARYPDASHHWDMGSHEDYKYAGSFSACSHAEQVDGYKALACVVYQASEGNVLETEFYRELLEIKRVLAMHIVASLPEYETAKWD